MKKSILKETHFDKFSRVFEEAFGILPYEHLTEVLEIIKKVEPKLITPAMVTEALYAKNKEGKYALPYEEILNPVSRLQNGKGDAELFLAYCFYSSGKKLYKIEDNLAELLLKTSLKKVDSDFLKSPGQTIYLQLPENSEMLMPHVDSPIEGIYVYLDSHENEVGVKEYFFSYSMVGGNGMTGDSFILDEGEIFEQMEKEFEKKFEKNSLEVLMGTLAKNGFKRELDDESKRRIQVGRNFVINALLYITCANARVELFHTELPYQGKNKAKARKRNKNQSGLKNFYSVGRKILGPQQGGKGTGTGTKITARFKVAPHWHTYWVGEGRKEKKLKWLCEYEKGKEFAEVLENRETVVK